MRSLLGHSSLVAYRKATRARQLFMNNTKRKMSLIYALDILMKSCRFCS